MGSNTRNRKEHTMQDRMSIILFSGTLDKLMAASILTGGAAAMGMEVELFLTMWGLLAFRKDADPTQMHISADFAAQESQMLQVMQTKKVPSWQENIESAKEVGLVKVYACGMSMDLFDLHHEDLTLVDDVVGVATFAERAKEGKITLFI